MWHSDKTINVFACIFAFWLVKHWYIRWEMRLWRTGNRYIILICLDHCVCVIKIDDFRLTNANRNERLKCLLIRWDAHTNSQLKFYLLPLLIGLVHSFDLPHLLIGLVHFFDLPPLLIPFIKPYLESPLVWKYIDVLQIIVIYFHNVICDWPIHTKNI